MSDPFGGDGRPFTHEGFAPVPPDETRKSKRSFRAVSPKQISLTFLDQWNAAPPSTAPALSRSRQGRRPHNLRTSKPTTSGETSPPDEAVVMPQDCASRPASSGVHLAVSDDFLKPSPRQDLSPRPTTASVQSTQFPSLSNRLRAQISIAPAASAAIRATLSRPAAPTAPGSEPLTVPQPPLLSAPPPPSSSSSSHRAYPHITPTPAPAIPRTDSVESIQASLASTHFEDMNLRQVLEYFLLASDEDSTARAAFVHVAPRYHIEPIPKPNFYDLVVLERPGFPHSGFVWSREHIRYAQDYHVLPSHKIMQLSLQGLLVHPDPDHPVELVPLPVFLHEKYQFDCLRRKRFFGLFRELKVFRAWHRHTQQAYVHRMKQALLKDSFFSNRELVDVQGEIVHAMYDLEVSVELFAFSPKGLVWISDYFSHQLRHLDEASAQVVRRIQSLADKITRQHQLFLSSKRLADLVQEVKDHHPLRHQMREEGALSSPDSPPLSAPIDWIRLRSIQRLEESFKHKLKALVRMAQYRVEEKVALLVERFWRRFKQLVVGLHSVRGRRERDDERYWDMDPALFHANGTLRLSAFEANEALARTTAQPSPPERGTEAGPPGSVQGSGDRSLESSSPLSSSSQSNPLMESEHSLFTKYPTTCAKVSSDWERQGCHLCLHVELYAHNRVMETQDLLSLQTLEGVSVAITPNKTHLLHRMHQLCGALGRLIEAIPDLNKHPLVYVPDHRPVYGAPDVDLGLGDLHHAQSSNYFTVLIMHPTYNSRFAYQLAVDSIRLLHAAYAEAASIDGHVFRMLEMVRKLWSTTPTSLVRQIERSVAVPKLRAFIDQPDSVEDLKRSQLRDKSRLVAFRTAAAYLDALPAQLDRIDNLKHRLGLVSSFAPLVAQISLYRAIQDHGLHQRLPSAYATRCMIFYEFVRKLEVSLDAQNKSSMELIDLMRRLKNFDHIKDYFDGEVDFCESMYRILVADQQRHKDAHPSAKEHVVASLVSSRGRLVASSSSSPPVIQPEKLHKLFEETLERLALGMSRLRSYLLSQLEDLREAVLVSRRQVHGGIRSLQEKVQAFAFVMHSPSPVQEKWEEKEEKERDGEESEEEEEEKDEEDKGEEDADREERGEGRDAETAMGEALPLQVDCSPDSENERINHYRDDVAHLRRVIDDNVLAQQLLLESHDIVGAANPILLPSQVDFFLEMEALEKVYDTKCLAWKVLKEMAAILSTLATLRMSAINIPEMYDKFVFLKRSVDFLRLNLEDQALLGMIEEQFRALTPKIELVAFLASKALRSRHWTHLALYALRFCGIEVKLSGKQSEFVALMDVTGRDPVGLGNVNRVMARDLLARNVEKYLRSIKLIVSEAVIESYLEATLDSVNDSLRLAMVQTSGEWLRDSRLRERVLVELNEITNLHLLRVLSRYCWKAILLVDATAQDMGLLSFDLRLSQSKDFSLKIDRFLETYSEVQYYWFYVLHFIKFAGRGELDRDSIRSFHSCTEEMKKMEVILQQKSGNLYAAFLSSNESDLNTDLLRNSLNSILDDVHSHVQSLVDACPRLSLLSYNRLVALARVWLTGPQQNLAFVSTCLGEMFEGVGSLQVALQSSQKQYVCHGFISRSKLDKVVFVEPIPLNVDLDVFVVQFSDGIRCAIEKACDLLILHRINCMKSLLSHATPDVVVRNMHSLFHLRVDHLEAMIHPDVPLSTFLLINSVSYAEDVWTCLGHPTGSLTMARPDLVIENVLFAQAWKDLLGHFVQGCENNLVLLQSHLAEGKSFARTSTSKAQAILSGWILQEMYYLQVAQRLLQCTCVESAIELWMGHYQLRFQYSKDQRYRSCPLDVILGNISLPYGMEYQETGTAWLPRRELDYVLSRVLSSAFSMRGTTLIHASESAHVLRHQPGELTISGADIAHSLGRLCTTLVHPGHLPNVRYFFARMILLDAVGCVDFTTINQLGLQNVIHVAQTFWAALDNKNDQVLQESLKYPLRTRFSRNEIHSERRKTALRTFRNDTFVRQKLNLYVGFVLIGFGSETEFQDLMVSDQFYRSIFDAVTVPYAAAYTQLGALLSSAGFMYALDLQASLVQALQTIFHKADSDADLDTTALQSISTLNGLTSLARICGISMNLARGTAAAATVASTSMAAPRGSTAGTDHKPSDMNPVTRYRDEVLCFCANLWEKVLSLLNGRKVSVEKLRHELLAPFLAKLEPVASVEDQKLLQEYTGGERTQFRDAVQYSVIKAANSTGLLCKSVFVQLCAQLVDVLQTADVPVVILHGDPSVGKTAVWKTAVTALSRLTVLDGQTESAAPPVARRLAAAKILALLRRHAVQRKWDRAREAERESTPEIGEPGRAEGLAPAAGTEDRRRGSADRRPTRNLAETSRGSVSVVFHASLSLPALLGGYDAHGRWTDGLLVRKLRTLNEQAQASEQRRMQTCPAVPGTSPRQYFLVLNGPITMALEQLLHAMYFQSFRALSSPWAGMRLSRRQVLLPTNEYLSLAPNVRIVIETSDLRHASPAALNLIPSVPVTCTCEDSLARLMGVWTRSLVHWLGDFPPWLDFLDELQKLLLGTAFVQDLLYEDLAGDHPSTALVNARLGAFLRILEELLLRCHELAWPHAVFHPSGELDAVGPSQSDTSGSDADSDDGAAREASREDSQASLRGGTHPRGAEGPGGRPLPSSSAPRHVGCMSLHPRARDLLLQRARLSVVYAAIWGFGGTFNGSDKRKFFDNLLRDNVQSYLHESVVVPTDCLVFELVLDLEHTALLPALQYDHPLHSVLTNPFLTPKQLEQHVYCEWMGDRPSWGKTHRDLLVFRSMSTRAMEAVFRILLASGANVLMFGPKGCGKTRLILETLEYLSQGCPSPSDLRQQIVDSLLEISAGTTKPQGIIRALEIVRTILPKIARMHIASHPGRSAAEETPEFNDLWRSLNSDLESYMSGSSRYNCQVRAVSSSVTSLTAHTGAREMRSWFEREFATEVPHVLETARFSYGLAFIDDVHCLATPTSAKESSMQESLANRVDELLRGLLDGFPAFSISRKAMTRSAATLGHHPGSVDGSFRPNPGSPPILHREALSDVRMQHPHSDDYMLQRMGLVCAATGPYTEHSTLSWLRSVGAHFAVVSLPAFTAAELHVAVMAGSVVSLLHTLPDPTLLDVLQSDVADLSRMTVAVCARMVASADLLLTTSQERVVRSMVALDVSLAARFAASLRLGCVHVKNPGGLLQVFVHEWKRHFLDALPRGNQRDRLLALFTDQLDGLDEKAWAVSRDWMKDLKDELAANIDRVWIDPRALHGGGGASLSAGGTVGDGRSPYIPVGLDTLATQLVARSEAWDVATQTFAPDVSVDDVLQRCGGEAPRRIVLPGLTTAAVQSVLYPAALCLLLRMVRVLTVTGEHVLLAGYPGSSRHTTAVLAARICGLHPYSFAVKESPSVSDSCSSKAAAVFQVRLFVKSMVLRAAGLSDPVTAEDYDAGAMHGALLLPGQVYYDVLPAEEEVVMVLDEAQQLAEDDRRQLRLLVEYGDPSGLFADNELHGMVEALRRKFKFASEIPTSSVPSSPVAKQSDAPFPEDGDEAAPAGPLRPRPSAKDGEDDDAPQPALASSSPSPSPSPSPSKAAGGSQAGRPRSPLTGYLFRWIQSHLQASVRRNLRIVLSLTLTRSVEIHADMFYSSRDSFAALRKLTGGQGAGPTQARRPGGGGSKGTAASATSGHARKTSASSSSSSSSSSFSSQGTGRRFSVRSDRSLASSSDAVGGRRTSHVYNPAASGAAESAPSSGARDSVHDADDLSAPLAASTFASALPATATGETAAGLAGQNASHGNLALPVALGLFTCPILGPLLHRRFHLVWYDVDSHDAIAGVCTVAMKNRRGARPPPPLLLSLRSSAVGVYTPAPAPPAPAPTPTAPPPRRLSVLEQHARDRDERRRQRFLFSPTATNKYHLVLCPEDVQAGLDVQAWEDSIFSLSRGYGVLQSMRNDVPCTSAAAVADAVLPYFVEEARCVLPALLGLPLPCDGLFLREAVVSTPTAEQIADRAARCVLRILQHDARALVERKHVLEQVLVGLQDASTILDHDTDMDSQLVQQNDALTALVRMISKQREETAAALDGVAVAFQRDVEYEREEMLREDVETAQRQLHDWLADIEAVLRDCRGQLQAFSGEDWQAFRSVYVSKPYPKPMIEIMRALLVLIPFTPPRILKGDKGAAASSSGASPSAKMDDDLVARCAASLLARPADLVHQLCAVQSATLSTAQFHALRIMNSLLNSSFVPYFNSDDVSPPQRWIAQCRRAGRQVDAHPVFDTLRVYFLTLDMHVVAEAHVRHQADDIAQRHAAWQATRQANLQTQADQAAAYRAVLDRQTLQAQGLDASLIANRRKLDILDRNRERKPRITTALTQLRQVVQEEYTRLNHVLQCLVGDVCIAITLVQRCGWLPESVRQDCLEVARRHLRTHQITTSEGPFLPGALFDRLHYRQSLTFHDSLALGMDVPCINAVAMLYLAPKHVLVIDPDGVAPQAVLDCAPKGYDVYSLVAQRFSLAVFEAWVQAAYARDGKDCALYVILHDLQAGVSEDLVALLTARLDPQLPAGYSSPSSSSSSSSPPAWVGDGLDAFLPRLLLNTAPLRRGSSSEAVVYLPRRFRLVLVSTRPPVFNAYGDTRPLPLACMEDVTVLHWPSTSCSFYLDPRPLDTPCERLSLTSNLLSCQLAVRLLPHLGGAGLPAPSVLARLQTCNQQIVATSHELIARENDVIAAVYTWLEQDRLASAMPACGSAQSAALADLSLPTALSLSILSSEAMIERLVQSISPREDLQAALAGQRLHLRESLAYLEAVAEVFSMAADYLRLVGVCLPAHDVLAPYCLTPAALRQNWVPRAVASAGEDVRHAGYKPPPSLYAALLVSRGLSAFQRGYRQWKARGGPRQSSSSSSSTAARGPPASSGARERGRTRRVVPLAEASRRATDEGGRLAGLAPSAREKALLVVHYCLHPLRARLLREMVRYVELHLRPGMEYLAKYLLVLAVWAQSGEGDADEVRALFHWLLDVHGVADARYVHLFPLPPAVQDDRAVPRLTAQVLRQSHAQWTQQMRRVSVASRRPRTASLAPPGEKDDEGKEGQEKEEHGGEDGEEEEEEGEGFLDELPGQGRMHHRVTAFRALHGPRSSPSPSPSSRPRRGGAPPPLWSFGLLVERGEGLPDGLAFNRRCTSWEVVPVRSPGRPAAVAVPLPLALPARRGQPPGYDRLLADDVSGRVAQRTVVIMADHQVDVQLRSPRVRPPVHYGDAFEVDWLKHRGVRAFHTANALALQRLGASRQSLEDIQQARRQTVSAARLGAGLGAGMGGASTGPSLAAARRRGSTAAADRRASLRTAAMPLSSRGRTARPPSLLEDMLDVPSPADETSSRHARTSSSSSSSRFARPPRGGRGGPSPGLALGPPGLSPAPDDLLEVVHDRRAFACLLLLETHPSLRRVFRGITGYIGRNAADWLDWRDGLVAHGMGGRETRKARQCPGEDDVRDWLERLPPPVCLEHSARDAPGASETGDDRGLFLRGYQLSVLQSLLLSEALWPGMAAQWMDAVWAVVRQYLLRGGYAVVYGDELLVDDNDAFEDKDSDEDEEEEEEDDEENEEDGDGDGDRFPVHPHGLPLAMAVGEMSRDDRLRKASQSSFFRSLHAYEASLDADIRLQEHVSPTNCWRHLTHALVRVDGGMPLAMPEPVHAFTGSTQGMRHYFPWEGVVVAVAAQDVDVDKFVSLKALRETVAGRQTTYFLAPYTVPRDPPQLSVFSQRARDVSWLACRPMPILFGDVDHSAGDSAASWLLSDLSAVGDAGRTAKATRSQVADLIKAVKHAVATSSWKMALVERVNLAAWEGAALLYAVLLPTVVYRSAEAASVGTGKEDGRGAREAFPLIATSAWGKVAHTCVQRVGEAVEGAGETSSMLAAVAASGGDAGAAPPLALAELSFAWLPRCLAPDIVRLQHDPPPASVSLPESCGVLYDELEASLVWVLTATRRLSHTRITPEVLQRLRRTHKLHLRMISVLWTIAQLHAYLRAQAYEARGLQGLWSASLTPMDLWQLSRVVVKLSEVMDVAWTVRLTRQDLVGHAPFRHAVHVLLESFSRPGMDFYRTAAPRPAPPLDTDGRAGEGKRPRAAGLAAVAEAALLAGRPPSTPEEVAAATSSGVHKVRHVRAQRQWRKAMRKVEEGRAQYVHRLGNAYRFRDWYGPGTGTDDAASARAEAVLADRADQQYVDDVHASLQHRWEALVLHYIAELVVARRRQQHLLVAEEVSTPTDPEVAEEEVHAGRESRSSTRQVRASTRVEKVATHILNARKQSHKMNIRSVIADTVPAQVSPDTRERAVWPLELAVGVLSPEDTLQAMVKWTLDGSDVGEDGRSRSRGVDRRRVLRSIKKLAQHVRQQIEAQQQKQQQQT